jgi:hypothetical protein
MSFVRDPCAIQWRMMANGGQWQSTETTPELGKCSCALVTELPLKGFTRLRSEVRVL